MPQVQTGLSGSNAEQPWRCPLCAQLLPICSSPASALGSRGHRSGTCPCHSQLLDQRITCRFVVGSGLVFHPGVPYTLVLRRQQRGKGAMGGWSQGFSLPSGGGCGPHCSLGAAAGAAVSAPRRDVPRSLSSSAGTRPLIWASDGRAAGLAAELRLRPRRGAGSNTIRLRHRSSPATTAKWAADKTHISQLSVFFVAEPR